MNVLMMLTAVSAFAYAPDFTYASEEGIEMSDTLSAVTVVTDFKQSLPLSSLASPVSTFYLNDIDDKGLSSPKQLSGMVPNLHIPDYGSAMTSSVYLRGFGSRMDNPVMGLYVDGIPVLNKNNYEFDMLDIRRLDLYRGPQGTLYGRNSLCGVLSVSTLSPSLYQGVRAELEYGSANTVSAGVSAYGVNAKGLAAGAVLSWRHTDGFYVNEYTGENCDPSDALSFRLRIEKDFTSRLHFENVLSASALSQGGWPYRHYSEGVLLPTAYDGESSYRRLNITEGLIFRYEAERLALSSVTSWQFLADDMKLDQDFTASPVFSLNQMQREHAVTQEFVLKPRGERRCRWWNWQTGVSGFFRHNDLSAPVTFLPDGISSLIEDNVNGVFQNPSIPFGMTFDLVEDNFVISSDFALMSWNAAVYHESYFTVGKWLFTAGLRLDYEGGRMDYDSGADVHYSLSPFFEDRPFSTEYAGTVRNGWLEVIPKVSVLYDASDFGGRGSLRLFAVASKGYRAGGFNTQIFSDILQNMMMSGMMSDAMSQVMPGGGQGGSGRPGAGQGETGGAAAGGSSVPDAMSTAYRPERSFNYEVGGNFDLSLPSCGGPLDLSGSFSAFWIDCRDQQMTYFPPGQGTGRMMTNIGRSRSIGLEARLGCSWRGLHVAASYGLSDARFVEYDDGTADWSGNRIPYSPANTLYAEAGYRFGIPSDILRSVSVTADVSGLGQIWWNEANTLSQPFRAEVGADMSLAFKMFTLSFRADNINGAEYALFYFRSVENDFFQVSRPFRWTVSLRFEI